MGGLCNGAFVDTGPWCPGASVASGLDILEADLLVVVVLVDGFAEELIVIEDSDLAVRAVGVGRDEPLDSGIQSTQGPFRCRPGLPRRVAVPWVPVTTSVTDSPGCRFQEHLVAGHSARWAISERADTAVSTKSSNVADADARSSVSSAAHRSKTPFLAAPTKLATSWTSNARNWPRT